MKAYGGEGNLRRVNSFRAEGVITAVVDRSVGETVRWFERPDRLRIELRYPERGEVRLTDGPRGWVGRDDRDLTPAPEPLLGAMRLQTARLDLLLRLKEEIATLVLMAPDGEGRPVLRGFLDEALTLDYHIDGKSHRVEHVTLRMAGAPEIVSFEVAYEGFRWVEGVLFPFKETTFTNGEKTAEVRIRNLELNPVMAPGLFGPGER